MMKLSMLAMLLFLAAMAAGAEEKKSTAGPGVQPVSAPMPMPGLDRERRIRVYLPPGYATSTKRYPVLYMHDGQNLFDEATGFAGEWGVDETLDRLAREQGLELIVVGIDNSDQRIHELKPWADPKYGAGEADAYLRFVVEVVKPFVDGHYRTRPGRKHTGIMGSSLGGLTSWYAAFVHPEVFGRIGVFSPSYWIAPQAYELARSKPLPRGMRMYQSIGEREGSDAKDQVETVAAAARMEAVLRHDQPRLQLRAVQRAGAEHNERAWREEFPAAVLYLFGRD
jgi:predicted alpha/beta superfamily hydrolase